MNKEELECFFDRLFPINRSITGEGYRKSLDILQEKIPFRYFDFESGKKVYDWTIPEEWHVEEAYITGPGGEKVLDYRDSNLHVVNYSAPVDEQLEMEDLKKHLHSIPEYPDAIPYVTSYYKRTWGFCLSHHRLQSLQPGKYRAVIRSSFKKGILRVGECLLPGTSKNEILLTSYLCHPSLANNELGGPLALMYIYNRLKKLPIRRFTYRFVINPETIGSIAYLSEKFSELKKPVVGGMVLNCLGGPQEKLSYKNSKSSSSPIDHFFNNKANEGQLHLRKFSPFGGSDERQYNSPGINLPIGQLARTIYEEHPEYHNSMDNKEFFNINQLERSCTEIFNFLLEIEDLEIFRRKNGKGEPFLSNYNLYPSINNNRTRKQNSGDNLEDGKRRQRTVMFLLSYCDGKNSINEISRLIGEDIEYVRDLALLLEEKDLIERI